MQGICLNDNCYNMAKQLSKKLEFLSHLNRYIEDAHKGGDAQTESTWNAIRADEEKHTDMLRNLLISEVKNNRL